MQIPQHTELDPPKGRSSLIIVVLFGLLLFVYAVGVGLRRGAGLEPSDTLEMLYRLGFIWVVVWWLRSDVKRSAAQRVYCSGLLVMVGAWIIVPYHLLKTRRAKGLLLLLAWLGMFFVAQLIAVYVGILITAV
jgi:hypothetical protein